MHLRHRTTSIRINNMNRPYLILCALAFTSIAFTPSAAPLAQQRDYKSGLNHTYIRQNAPSPQPPPETVSETTETIGGADETTKSDTKDTPTSSVWKKYRALAAGQAKDKDETAEAEKENTPATPAKPSAPETTANDPQQKTALKPTGIAAIIEDYRKNKEQRSQVKSLRIHRPATPTVNPPTVKSPTLETAKNAN